MNWQIGVRERCAQVLGRPVPSHEDVRLTVLELCDRLEAAEHREERR